MKIVHITPHLGGGVGKAVASLLGKSQSHHNVNHDIFCLEKAELTHNYDLIINNGHSIVEEPTCEELNEAIIQADIVQVEFWNHPKIPKILCALNNKPMRLLLWCHISGLGEVCIPSELFKTNATVVFTSPCSLNINQKCSIVSSGCVDELPKVKPSFNKNPKIGYVGTIDFVKLHPQFIEWLVDIPKSMLPVEMLGNGRDMNSIKNTCEKLGRNDIFNFNGHVENIYEKLDEIDVLIYLLNPKHYGTAENALIESMAMGVVPIVVNNPAESYIVDDEITGFIVRDKEEFQVALNKLMTDHVLRKNISTNAHNKIRSKYTQNLMQENMLSEYKLLMQSKPALYDFSKVFGVTPVEWYLSFRSDKKINKVNSNAEARKGSVNHFITEFPDDRILKSYLL